MDPPSGPGTLGLEQPSCRRVEGPDLRQVVVETLHLHGRQLHSAALRQGRGTLAHL